MSKIYYITHPLAKVDPSKPPHTWELPEIAYDEIERLCELEFWTDIDYGFTSTELKAKQTADEITRLTGVKFTEDRRLNEVNRGDFKFEQLQTYLRHIEDFYLHPQDACNGWEKAIDALHRIVEFVNEVYKSSDNIVLIGHGILGTLLACYLKKIDPTFNEDPKISGCMMIIDWDDKRILSDWEKY